MPLEEVNAASIDFESRSCSKDLRVDEGVKSFSDSYESLLNAIKDKASELVHAS